MSVCCCCLTDRRDGSCTQSWLKALATKHFPCIHKPLHQSSCCCCRGNLLECSWLPLCTHPAAVCFPQLFPFKLEMLTIPQICELCSSHTAASSLKESLIDVKDLNGAKRQTTSVPCSFPTCQHGKAEAGSRRGSGQRSAPTPALRHSLRASACISPRCTQSGYQGAGCQRQLCCSPCLMLWASQGNPQLHTQKSLQILHSKRLCKAK